MKTRLQDALIGLRIIVDVITIAITVPDGQDVTLGKPFAGIEAALCWVLDSHWNGLMGLRPRLNDSSRKAL